MSALGEVKEVVRRAEGAVDGAGCSCCGRRFWPSPTQQRKRLVPVHDSPGGICDGSLTETVDEED
jgi:hypothetical protein